MRDVPSNGIRVAVTDQADEHWCNHANLATRKETLENKQWYMTVESEADPALAPFGVMGTQYPFSA